VPSKWSVKTNEPAPEIVNRRPENAAENAKNSKADKAKKENEDDEDEDGDEDEDEEEEEEADDDEAGMDVKNLAQKWDESIAAGEEDGLLGKKKPKKRLAKSADAKIGKNTADGVKIKAKELREHFEQITQMVRCHMADCQLTKWSID
jgi:hypothetical protein